MVPAKGLARHHGPGCATCRGSGVYTSPSFFPSCASSIRRQVARTPAALPTRWRTTGTELSRQPQSRFDPALPATRDPPGSTGRARQLESAATVLNRKLSVANTPVLWAQDRAYAALGLKALWSGVVVEVPCNLVMEVISVAPESHVDIRPIHALAVGKVPCMQKYVCELRIGKKGYEHVFVHV